MTERERNRRRKILVFGTLTGIVMAMIYAFSAQSGNESSGLSQWFINTRIGQVLLLILPKLSDNGETFDIRKYAHMAEFFLLSMVSFPFFRNLICRWKELRIFLLDFLFCFLYACSDEWHQTFIPQRSGRFADVLIDCAGVLIGLLLHNLLRKIQRRNQNRVR